jgi:hypothetical protein
MIIFWLRSPGLPWSFRRGRRRKEWQPPVRSGAAPPGVWDQGAELFDKLRRGEQKISCAIRPGGFEDEFDLAFLCDLKSVIGKWPTGHIFHKGSQLIPLIAFDSGTSVEAKPVDAVALGAFSQRDFFSETESRADSSHILSSVRTEGNAPSQGRLGFIMVIGFYMSRNSSFLLTSLALLTCLVFNSQNNVGFRITSKATGIETSSQ